MPTEAHDPAGPPPAPAGQDGTGQDGAGQDGAGQAAPGPAQQQARELVHSVHDLEVDPPPPDR